MVLSFQKKLEFNKINSTFPILKKVLLFLMGGILFSCLLHIYAMTMSTIDFARNEKLKIHDDMGYAEIFQYLQFITVAFIALIMFKKKKKFIYIIWSLFFITLLLDDAFRIHELGREIFV